MNRIYTFSFILLCALIGLLFQATKTNLYHSTFTLTANSIPLDLIQSTLNENNELIEQENYELVAQNMNLEEEQVKKIMSISFEQVMGVFANYKTIYVKPFKIHVSYSDTSIKKNLSKIIFSYLNKISSVGNKLELEKKNIELKNNLEEYNNIDSLLKTIDASSNSYPRLREFHYNLSKENLGLATHIKYLKESTDILNISHIDNKKSLKVYAISAGIGLALGVIIVLAFLSIQVIVAEFRTS